MKRMIWRAVIMTVAALLSVVGMPLVSLAQGQETELKALPTWPQFKG